MLFQYVTNLGQLAVALRHNLFHGGEFTVLVLDAVDRLGGADTCHYIFALGIDQKFAVEVVLAGGGIAGKGHAGGAVVAHVAEYHRLYVDGCAPLGRDVVKSAIGDSALVHPGTKDSTDGTPQLLLGIFGKRLSQFFFDNRLELGDQVFPVPGCQVGIQVDTTLLFFLFQQVVQDVLFHTHDDVGIHLHEAAVGIVSETFITALGDDALNGDVVETKVKNRIHHARHGGPGAGTDGNKQGVMRVAELLAHQFFDLFEIGGYFGSQ